MFNDTSKFLAMFGGGVYVLDYFLFLIFNLCCGILEASYIHWECSIITALGNTNK